MTDDETSKPARTKYEQVGELVSIYQREKTWWVHYQWQQKQVRHTLGTPSKKEARSRALAEERDLIDGRMKRLQQVPTIAEAVELYMNYLIAMDRAVKTLGKYKFCFDLLMEVAGRRGAKRVCDIDLNLVDAFRADRVAGDAKQKRKPAAPKTVTNDIVAIRQLINFCLRRKLIREDPLAELEIRKPPRTIQPVWSWDEVQTILTKAKSPFLEPLVFYAESGARFGEGQWLTWKDVELKKGVIHIQPKDGWRPKTGEQRVFPMSPRIKEMLERMPKRYRWVFTARPTPRYPGKGRQISERTLLAYLRKILNELGLEGHLHTFKHSFVTHAVIDMNVSRAVVRRCVGTLDDRVLDYYVHVHDQQAHEMMKRVTGTSRTITEDDETLP